MAKKHLLQELTWVEFRERLGDDPTVLLPFGSQEEQGPQAPMGDYMLTERIAGMIAERSGAIAAPTVPFGYADYFRAVPGGIQLRPETFRALFEDICDNFLDHGIDRLIVINGHSGNFPLIDQSIRKIKRDRGVWIPCINLWRIMTAVEWKAFHGERSMSAMGHGGDPLTSVYLHLFPDLMRMDLVDTVERKSVLGLPTSGLNAVSFKGVDVNIALDIDDICDNGIAGGDPATSSPEIGAKIVEHVVDFCVEFVNHFRSVDPKVRHRAAPRAANRRVTSEEERT